MNVTQQLEYLIKLGERLDEWFTLDALKQSDLFFGEPLGEGPERFLFAQADEARLLDVLLARLIRVKDYSTQKPVPLVIGPAQRDYSRKRTDKNIILKSGKVWFTAYLALANLVRIATKPGHVALLAAHEQKSVQDFFNAVHCAWEWLPGKLGEILRDGALRRGKSNVREIYFPELNSRYFVDTTGAAAGLGQSYQFLHGTEVSRWEGDVQQTYATLASHVIGDNQEITLESRPFGDRGFFHDTYWQAKRGENEFKAHFYEWWWNPGHTKRSDVEIEMTEKERSLAARYEAWRAKRPESGLPEQLKPGQFKWRRSQHKELRAKAPQEFAEDEVSCFLGSGNCPFDATAINSILERSTPPIETDLISDEEENGWMCWEQPEKGEDYILFVDPAGGMGLSRQAIQLIRRSTGAQVGEWVGRGSALELGRRARKIGVRFNGALIAVETNLGDISVTVYEALKGYTKLYWRNEPNGGKKLGWKTDGATRPAMMDTLDEILTDSPGLFRSRRLAADIRTHVRNGDRIEPAKGFTGDLTIAMAGAHSVRARSSKRSEPWITSVRLDERF